ncbi:MAG: nicotinamide riboside transporter PnuC [Aquabacterium sp.]
MLSLDAIAASLAWADPWLAPWFTALGVAVSQLEVAAFALSLLMVWLNLRVNVWAWPLAIVSSALYGLLFARSRLYGEASLQAVFIAVSVWGWWQWLRGRDDSAQPLKVRALGRRGRIGSLSLTAMAWPLIGLLLDHATDSDVPYLDALPTAGSLLGQWLLGRKWIDNWPCWLVVNLVSMGLFAYKQLWLTVLLYGLFAALSVAGWRAWRALAEQQRSAP